jgi:methylenetetrahydrofolate dehydrogenase (NADP+) / methenyltetrahydrofolate cyclohydrolase
MSNLMSGRRLSEEIKKNVSNEVKKLNNAGYDVGLALVLCGENLSSKQYLSATVKACRTTGITPYEYRFPENVSTNELLNTIHSLNRDERINGILIFFPLPPKLDGRKIVNAIIPQKDIDGLGSVAIGKFAAEESTMQLYSSHEISIQPNFSGFLPCTPFGVIRLLEYFDIDLTGKHAVVIGKSLAVGKPLSLMLLTKNATVSVCHKATENLSAITKEADILCVAAGKRNLITGEMLKEGVIVIDIGINVLQDGSVSGDVEFETVSPKASLITPVPGGVGPVTIAMLLKNTVKSAKAKL